MDRREMRCGGKMPDFPDGCAIAAAVLSGMVFALAVWEAAARLGIGSRLPRLRLRARPGSGETSGRGNRFGKTGTGEGGPKAGNSAGIVVDSTARMGGEPDTEGETREALRLVLNYSPETAYGVQNGKGGGG